MKAIIQAYSPKELERIARGEQTVKVCKTAPKDTPFKVYMYCTKDGYMYRCRFDENRLAIPELWNGKVVGEFVCDKIEECIPDYNPVTQEFFYNEWADCSASCLTSKEEAEYGKGKPLKGLHIPTVKFYDKPKELGEFKKYNRTCKFSDLGYAIPNCETCRDCNLTHAPRGWQYVEPLDK